MIGRFRSGRFAALAAALCVFCAQVSRAQEETRETSIEIVEGVEELVNVHSRWRRDCSFREFPPIELVESPSLGEVSIRETPRQIFDRDSGCYGVHIMGMGIFYRPRPGAHGEDRFAYRVRFGGRLRLVRVTASVERGGGF
ncbi:MAG: hypothetical protein AAFW46_00030 [Pseudomonadota bacterium]